MVGRINVDVRIVWLSAPFALAGFASFFTYLTVSIFWPAAHLSLNSLSRGGIFIALLIHLSAFACFAAKMPGRR